MTPQRLPLTTQTLYAQLLENLTAAELARSIGDLRGTFVTKKVRGRTYWYLQHREAGRARQVYLGPDSDEVRAVVERWREARPAARDARRERQRLCAMLRQGGAAALDASSARLLLLLAEGGVFRLGAVLVGTTAFRLYGNLLGVRWEESAIATQDLDLAHTAHLEVAATAGESVDLPGTLERAELGFTPIPALDHREPSTSFELFGREIRLDLLAPLVGRARKGPVKLPALRAHGQPLRFLDYLIEEPLSVATINDAGSLIQVPQPARFAWHKLIVAGRRPVSGQTKAGKDLRQADLLLEVLLEERAGDLVLAWEELEQRGPKWRAHALRGLGRLPEEIAGQARELLEPPDNRRSRPD